ncbi:MAG TPA: hypothetical protein VMZ90_06670 [Vicinamibacterales bacterium]|nr:hypothetical protein [Vicinamibacterales bacterium]
MSEATLNLPTNYPPATRGTIVVWGLMAAFPFPGMTWHRMQYLAGIRRLGFDVWYVEDSERTVLAPGTFDRQEDLTPNIEYLNRYMTAIGLGDRWIFRPPGDMTRCYGGRDIAGLWRLYEEADAVINHSGAQELQPRHSVIRTLVYLETDPTELQVRIAQGEAYPITVAERHHHRLTFGENLGQPDCLVPVERFTWLPTRPAVCVDWWDTSRPPGPDASLTTVGTFRNKGKDITWNGARWRWSKHEEFLKFIDIAATASLPLELAIGEISDKTRDRFVQNGWRVRSAWGLESPEAYRDYIWDSLGEFTVAKGQYVAPKTGWFSDRSATFLAAGRPVVTQETGFSKFIPTGDGLFGFSTRDEALAAIDAIARDYHRHAKAAQEIAREYFAAEKVIRRAFESIGLL